MLLYFHLIVQMCVCFCTFFIKVHDPSLRLTPQANLHSRKSSEKVSYFKFLLLLLHLHISSKLYHTLMSRWKHFIRLIHFWNNDNNFMGRPPPTGLDPTDRTAVELTPGKTHCNSKNHSCVRVNCWCPLEFDICQSFVVGGCCWCFCVVGNFSMRK